MSYCKLTLVHRRSFEITADRIALAKIPARVRKNNYGFQQSFCPNAFSIEAVHLDSLFQATKYKILEVQQMITEQLTPEADEALGKVYIFLLRKPRERLARRIHQVGTKAIPTQ